MHTHKCATRWPAYPPPSRTTPFYWEATSRAIGPGTPPRKTELNSSPSGGSRDHTPLPSNRPNGRTKPPASTTWLYGTHYPGPPN